MLADTQTHTRARVHAEWSDAALQTAREREEGVWGDSTCPAHAEQREYLTGIQYKRKTRWRAPTSGWKHACQGGASRNCRANCVIEVLTYVHTVRYTQVKGERKTVYAQTKTLVLDPPVRRSLCFFCLCSLPSCYGKEIPLRLFGKKEGERIRGAANASWHITGEHVQELGAKQSWWYVYIDEHYAMSKCRKVCPWSVCTVYSLLMQCFAAARVQYTLYMSKNKV